MNGWDPKQDRLRGTELYGYTSIDYEAWAIRFADDEYTHVKIESVDEVICKEYPKQEFSGNYFNNVFIKENKEFFYTKRGGVKIFIYNKKQD